MLGSVATAVYRSRMADAIPAGVPPEAAAAGRDTLGGALAAAQDLPEQVGGAMLDAARDAFTLGLHATAAISAALAIAIAVLAAVALRNARSGDDDAATDGDPAGERVAALAPHPEEPR